MARLVIAMLIVASMAYGQESAEESVVAMEAKVKDLERTVDTLSAMIVEMRLRMELLEQDAETDEESDDWPDQAPANDTEILVDPIIPPDSSYTNYYATFTGESGAALVSRHHASSLEFNTNGHYGLYQFQNPTEIEYDIETDDPNLAYANGTGYLFTAFSRLPLATDPPELVYFDLHEGLQDERVAVASDQTPGYLGETGGDGVLRCPEYGIEYTNDPANAVTISHKDLSNVYGAQGGTGNDVITGITLDSAKGSDGLGHVVSVIVSDINDLLPAATNSYDLLRWDSGTTEWKILPNDASVEKYMVLQKKGETGAGTEIGYDWVRFSGN